MAKKSKKHLKSVKYDIIELNGGGFMLFHSSFPHSEDEEKDRYQRKTLHVGELKATLYTRFRDLLTDDWLLLYFEVIKANIDAASEQETIIYQPEPIPFEE